MYVKVIEHQTRTESAALSLTQLQKPKIFHTLLHAFEPDTRSLFAFRLILAASLFFDLFQRFLEAPYFYSENGILPFALWQTLYGGEPYYWSLHFFSGQIWLIKGVLLVHLALALYLFIGCRTRWVCLLSWILFLSLVLRNPLLHYGADKLVPLLLLIAAFLPLSNKALRGSSWGLLARLAFFWLLLQITVLYVSSGQSKLVSPYWQDGTALHNVLDMNMLVRPVGVWLQQFEFLLKLMTWAVPWAEIALPLLFFLPLWRGRGRTLGVLGLLGLNLGIQTMLDVGYFMFYSTAGLVALLPTSFWDDLFRLFGKVSSSSTPFTAPLPSMQRPEPVVTGKHRALKGLIAVVMLGFMAITLATGLEGMKVVKISYPLGSWNFIRGLNMYQNWGLFTNPVPVAYWYVSKAKLKNGDWVDVFQNGGPITWDYQRNPNALFAHHSRWRAATTAVGSENMDRLSVAFGRALTQRWNNHHPPEMAVSELTIYLFSQTLPIDGETGRNWRVWLENLSVP